MREFSKIVLAVIVAVYVVTVIYSYFVVANSNDQLGALLAFVGTPTGIAIGFYAWKAKCENVIKYNKKQLEKLNKANITGGDNNADI